MDATVGAATKALDTLKALPTWLLAGLSISFFAIWLWPPFLLALPEPARSVVPVALFVTSVLTLCNVAALLLGHAAARREHSLERDRERLLQLYRPLETLFLTRHITVSTGRASPYLRHRLANAWEALHTGGRKLRRLKRAARAIIDKQESSSAEVEYGGDFPLHQIIELVRKNARHARPELLDLVSRADRSNYEEYDRVLLTDAEYALFEHIDGEHRRLSKRVG